MQNLGLEFLKKFNLEEQSTLVKAIACECFCLVYEQYTKEGLEDCRKICYPEELLNGNDMLIQVLALAGYWSNDLAYILTQSLTKQGIPTPLLEDANLYKPIHDFLIEKGFKPLR